jgi:hypothetical protein
MSEPTDAMKAPFQTIALEPIGYASYLGVPASTDLAALHDDNAVIKFSRAMMDKMAAGRAKGRSGWQDCPERVVWKMLRDHVEKGDPVDVACLAMIAWYREGCDDPMTLQDADREVARIMALSDTEVIAEAVAAGIDPHEEAEKCRRLFMDIKSRADKRWNGIPDNPEQDGWHWIKLYLSGQGHTGCYLWEGAWWYGGVLRRPDQMADSLRTEYLGPAVPPQSRDTIAVPATE